MSKALVRMSIAATGKKVDDIIDIVRYTDCKATTCRMLLPMQSIYRCNGKRVVIRMLNGTNNNYCGYFVTDIDDLLENDNE